jgi:hypothetical protein
MVLAALSLSACGGGDADADDAAGGDSLATVPAGTQPAPTAQHQAAPQTAPNTPSAVAAEAPPAGSASGRTFAECMREAGAASSEGEREVLAHTCRGLPGSPRVSPAGAARP